MNCFEFSLLLVIRLRRLFLFFNVLRFRGLWLRMVYCCRMLLCVFVFMMVKGSVDMVCVLLIEGVVLVLFLLF